MATTDGSGGSGGCAELQRSNEAAQEGTAQGQQCAFGTALGLGLFWGKLVDHLWKMALVVVGCCMQSLFGLRPLPQCLAVGVVVGCGSHVQSGPDRFCWLEHLDAG